MSGSNQEILEGIKNHLVGRGIDGAKVTLDAELGRDLDLDSLDTVELTLGLEKLFQVELPDEELEDLSTVGDVVDLIIEKKSAVGA